MSLKKFCFNVHGKYGDFSPLTLYQDQCLKQVACLHNINDKTRMLGLSNLSSGTVRLYDLNLCSEIVELDCESGRSTQLQMASESNLLVSSDNNCLISVFDTRVKSLISQFKIFKNSEELPISMDLEDTTLLLGTSEGPVTLDLRKPVADPCPTKYTGDYYKVSYLTHSSSKIVTGKIGAGVVHLLNSTAGEEGEIERFEVDSRGQIVDLDVCKDTGEIAVVYKREELVEDPVHSLGNSRLMILEPAHGKDRRELKIRDDFSVGSNVLRVGFTSGMEVCVVTEADWSVYSCRNDHFVKVLSEKVARKFSGAGLSKRA